MQINPFNNLPKINKKDALEILKKPLNEISFLADHYKAVFHLENFPCEETETALLEFIKYDNDQLEFKIARRKAIEVLSSFDCKKAIPLIAGYLKNDDDYLVETAIWSLVKLKCKDVDIINQISSILDEPFNNKRIVIQALTSLGAKKEIEKIRSFSQDKKLPTGLRGASIAALIRLAGEKDRLYELKDFLRLSNQNHRHCAVQDIINAGNVSMIPFLLKAPVSPSFKIKAIDSLWINEALIIDNLNLFNCLDSVILDNPNHIDTLKVNNFKNEIKFIIDQLFHTDFNRCYYSLNELFKYPSEEILYYLNINWDRAKVDYGAIYFFIKSYKFLLDKGIYDNSLLEKVDFLLGDKWPDYMKFKSLSILMMNCLDEFRFYSSFKRFSDETLTPYWLNRYSALIALQNNNNNNNNNLSKLFINDSHRFVRLKANQFL